MKKILSFFVLLTIVNVSKAQSYTPITLPAHSSTFTGNTRGYWFIAPTCFTITAADVPTDASSGAQSFAIMRLETNPPLFSATTDNFDVLYLTQNSADPDTIGLNIVVNQGDIIGILACRGTSNSYAPANFVSNINGLPITLGRLGMQFQLPNTAPQQIWTEAGSSLSRLNLYYDTTMLYNLTYSNIGADYTFADGTDTLYTSLFSVWDYGDGSALDTNYNPTHTYTANGTYTVCSYVHTACGIDTICTSVNVCLFGANAGFTTTAVGLDIDFNDASTNASGWYWNFGDGDTSTSQNPAHTYTNIGWYAVTQIVSNTCGPNDTIVDSIFVCTPPLADYTFNVVSGSTIDFTDNSTYGTHYDWSFGDGGTDTIANPSHTYANNQNYDICLITSNACGADTLCDSVLICPILPTAEYTYTNAVFSANFSNTSISNINTLWNFGDGNSSTLINPNHTYAAAGSYLVCLTSYNECGDSATFCDSVSILGNVGLEEFVNAQEINSYPNPSNGIMNIQINSTQVAEGSLFVTDITGKVVQMIYAGEFSSGNSAFTIQTNTWTNGIYLLVWNTDQWKISKKIIAN